jgi:hypothetical protein
MKRGIGSGSHDCKPYGLACLSHFLLLFLMHFAESSKDKELCSPATDVARSALPLGQSEREARQGPIRDQE